MSLLDLKSDLSKYRETVAKEDKNTPEASKTTSANNFATLQPISDKLAKLRPTIGEWKTNSIESLLNTTKLDDIKKPKTNSIQSLLNTTKLDDIKKPKTNFTPLEKKIGETKLDEINKKVLQNGLINSVSKLSPVNNQFDTQNVIEVYEEDVMSEIAKLRKEQFVSKLNKSDVKIKQFAIQETQLFSPIKIEESNISENIKNPEIEISVPRQTLDREQQSPDLKSKGVVLPDDDVVNPKIEINSAPLFNDLSSQSVVINKELFSPLNNVIDPKIALDKIEPIFDKSNQSPNIDTENNILGFITNPEIKVNKMDLSSIQEKDNSKLNIDISPKKYSLFTIGQFDFNSRLAALTPNEIVDTVRYDLTSNQLTDTSKLNIDTIIKPNQSGRNEDPSKSNYSVAGLQQVNLFPDTNASGFKAKVQKGVTQYLQNSEYDWEGSSNDNLLIPTVNFFSDTHATGFHKFAEKFKSYYNINSSQYGFNKIQETNFFDKENKFTMDGFKSFTEKNQTDYKLDSSVFGWLGKKNSAPEVDYFDVKKSNTNGGFHKFAQIYDTKYILDSSIYDWEGSKQKAPSVDYFDINKENTTSGFHTFAQLYDTKYILDSSQFDWNGNKQSAPNVDYFDLTKTNTTAGFHTFAQLYDTKYILDSSQFDWDGERNTAPSVNYFDLTDKNSTAGFHTFASFLDTKYILDSSQFDWDGNRQNAPSIDYFDLTKKNTTTGFHTFAQLYDTKYVLDSSIFDWDGNRQDAPSIDYFDLIKVNTTAGFHTFAEFLDTKYILDSSQFDWDGNRVNAPSVNYFDLISQNTTTGFHTFAQLYDTKYVLGSSIFDWDGVKSNAPNVDYFDLTKTNTTAGFHTFALHQDTKYIPESSIFDWDGNRSSAPFVNYFDLTNQNTTAGFHTFAPFLETKYIPESSRFDWDGFRLNAPNVDYFDLTKKNSTAGFHTFAQLYDTKYIPESSIFDWDGARIDAPNVDYFDIGGIHSKEGFHTFAQLYDTKYVHQSSRFDWDGTARGSLQNSVNFFFDTNATGFTKFVLPLATEYIPESSRFDWDGFRIDAPNVDYFDLTNNHTTVGFHTFAQLYDTKYIPESSQFDWDGTARGSLQNSVNFFFDTNATGFTKFPIPLVTEYVKESSRFDWDGFRQNAPAVNYFDLTAQYTTAGFHTFAQLYNTKYVPESSRFDWDGNARTSKQNSVNFFIDKYARGFTKFATPLQSEYVIGMSVFDWDGVRQNAPEVNFFIDKYARGFTKFAVPLLSQYVRDISRFDWDGARQNAPEIAFLNKIFIPNNQQFPIKVMNPGFKKFFIDKTQYDLRSEYSYFSTENGPNKSIIGIPVTNFFGFVPPKRNGFMVNMTMFDGTLYPLIGEQLEYNFDRAKRNFIQSIRTSNGLYIMSQRDKYAPVGLGKKLWRNGSSTVFASLTNQVPESKIDSESSYYGKPYEQTMKNLTNSLGYLTKWAITRRSLSPLEKQYTKYNLRDDSHNRDFGFDQPYVLRDIGQHWGFGIGFDEGLVRGGAVTAAERIVQDVFRVGKFLLSAKGLLFVVKQAGLQLMNPNVDKDPSGGAFGSVVDFFTTFGMSPTQIYNPLAMLVNVGGAPIGLRVPRHSLLGAIDSTSLNKYETATINRELASPPNDTVVNYFKSLDTPKSDGDTFNYSRLIGLMKELLPNSFRSLNPESTQNSDFLGHSKIHRISSNFGGPNAPLGIGGTKIRRARHPYLTYYTTDGNLPLGFANATFSTPGSGEFGAGGVLTYLGSTMIAATTNPAYPDTARRTQFYNQYDTTGNKSNTYTDVILDNYNTSNKAIFGDIIGLSAIFEDGPETGITNPTELNSTIANETITKIVGLKPYSPYRKLINSQVRKVTAYNADTLNDTRDLHGIAGSKQDDVDSNNSLKLYLASTYSNLIRRKKNKIPLPSEYQNSVSDELNDFRFSIWEQDSQNSFENNIAAYVTDPNIVGGYFKNRSLETYYGFGKQGKPGVDRSDPSISNIQYIDGAEKMSRPRQLNNKEFRGDRITILDYKTAETSLTRDLVYEVGKHNSSVLNGANDLIEFYFTGTTIKGRAGDPVEMIPFRASFGNITDNHNPKWNPVKYMGRGDPSYIYDGYERNISFDFTVHIGTRDELRPVWRKLNYLASWTAPEYTDIGTMKGPLVRLNLGHLYRKLPGFINSLSYSIDNTQTTWELGQLPDDWEEAQRKKEVVADPRKPRKRPEEEGIPNLGALQLPKHISVSVGFTPFGVYRPEWGGIMYQLYDDYFQDIETGLEPKQPSKKIDYFSSNGPAEKTPDTGGGNQGGNQGSNQGSNQGGNQGGGNGPSGGSKPDRGQDGINREQQGPTKPAPPKKRTIFPNGASKLAKLPEAINSIGVG